MLIPLKSKSIKKQLTFIFVSIVLITTIPLTLIASIQTLSQYKTSYDEAIDQQMKLVDAMVYNYAQNIISSTKTLADLPIMKEADKRIKSYQVGEAVEGLIEMIPEKGTQYEQEVYAILKTFQIAQPTIKNASLGVEDNGGFVMHPPKPRFIGYDARAREWYKKAIQNPKQVVVSGIYTTSSNEKVVLCVTTVFDDKNELRGVITVDFDLSVLSETIESTRLGKNGFLILTDQEGIILAHPHAPELIGEKIEKANFSNITSQTLNQRENFVSEDSDKNKYYTKIFNSSMTSFPLYYIAVLPEKELYSNSIQLIMNLLWALVILIFISIVLSYWISKNFTKPLIKLSELSEKVTSGELFHRLETELQRKDEIGDLANKFNQMIGALEESRKTLEEKVKARTKDYQEANKKLIQINEALSQTLDQLKSTQNQLIISEKLASLGGLVSGIAHEVNTPLGVAVTASTYLEKLIQELSLAFEKKTLTQSELAMVIHKTKDSIDVLTRNLERAADLIQNFKQVAVDQSSEMKRQITVKNYIEGILKSLYPHIKNRPIKVNVHCEEALSVETYPGALAQIVTNFVMNSLIHGFDPEDQGIIDITAFVEHGQFHLKYSDSGKGISESIKAKIFEPFNTTKRNQGGSGLGLHIVYNIVIYKLKGKILLDQEANLGSHFHIEWPI